jgi:SAM-dependent methyltransferase
VIDDDIQRYYERGRERERLTRDGGTLELIRTQELLQRYLPPPPADVLDVGGGPGVYAAWLALAGYRVHLIDPVPLHVAQAVAAAATQPTHPFTAAVGDARRLDEPDASCDAALLFGPLYHLTQRVERLAALAEARRVLRPGGLALVVAISRFGSLLDGVRQGYLGDPEAQVSIGIPDSNTSQTGSRRPTSTCPPNWRQRPLRADSPLRPSSASKGREASSATAGTTRRGARPSSARPAWWNTKRASSA